MFAYLYIGERNYSMRTIMINTGSILAFAVVLVLLYLQFVKNKKPQRLKCFLQYVLPPVAFQAMIALTIGKLLGGIVRGGYDSTRGGLLDNIKFSMEYVGDHFIGVVLSTAVLLPILFRTIYGKETARRLLNVFTLFIPIQHFFSRMGCFMEGCCYGIPYNGILSVKFPDEILTYRAFPSQIFEMTGMLLMLALIIFLLRKGKYVFRPAMLFFAVWIFLSEILIDKQGTVTYMNLSSVQFAAIALFVWELVDSLFEFIGNRKVVANRQRY